MPGRKGKYEAYMFSTNAKYQFLLQKHNYLTNSMLRYILSSQCIESGQDNVRF